MVRCLYLITYNKSSSCGNCSYQCPGIFLGIVVGQDYGDSKSSRLHVDIFRFCFNSFEEYSSIDSSNFFANSPEVSNFNRFICN